MAIYLDNSATTKPSEAVIEAMTASMREGWYNPSALYRTAMEAEKKVSAAREACLAAANAKGNRLIFTGSGTEADNIAILGTLRALKKGGKVFCSGIEHPAVRNCMEEAERLGFTTVEMPVRKDGTINTETLSEMLDDTARLICVMQVNNESGAIQPIAEIARLRDRLAPSCAIHVDGVQGFLRVPLDFNKLKIQSYAFSGHKIHASKGIGALIVRKDHKLSPIVFGGGQEEGYRSGTENTPGIIGLATAVQTFPKAGVAHMAALKRRLWTGLHEAIPSAEINGPDVESEASAPHILNVSLPPVRSQTMLFALEGDGIYVSSGSACASRKQKLSGTLLAMHVKPDMADSALRFSLCPELTEQDIDETVKAVAKHYALLAKYVRR